MESVSYDTMTPEQKLAEVKKIVTSWSAPQVTADPNMASGPLDASRLELKDAYNGKGKGNGKSWR
jgi:hypothetical protein